MDGLFWEILLGMLLLLVWGGLLALTTRYLGPLAEFLEPGAGPTRLGSEELGAPFSSPAPVRQVQPPAAPPAPSPAMRPGEPVDPLMAAAIGLALSLHLGKPAAVAVSAWPRPAAGNPWPLAGRLQTMQARLRLQKR
ncbi:MAG: hypothetical protein FJ128_04625 [Deltaproteobacteria bacterium]|nr:hypothetical protein [Deltaproteobacteria bacterium]